MNYPMNYPNYDNWWHILAWIENCILAVYFPDLLVGIPNYIYLAMVDDTKTRLVFCNDFLDNMQHSYYST